MGMSGMYGPADRAESIATIHAALDAGITLIDTGDFYGMGHNEMLIAEALKGVPRDRYQLSVKFGALRDPSGAWVGFDARPAAVKNFLAHSLQRLGVDHIDIYRPARLDPGVPIEDTVGAIAEMVKAGYVGHAGLSEVGVRHHPPGGRGCADLRPPDRIFAHLPRDRGQHSARSPPGGRRGHRLWRAVARPHQRTLVEGRARPADCRASPRFQGENVDHNLALVEACETSPRPAERASRRWRSHGRWRKATTSSRSSARAQRGQWVESSAARRVRLADADLAAIEQAAPKRRGQGRAVPRRGHGASRQREAGMISHVRTQP